MSEPSRLGLAQEFFSGTFGLAGSQGKDLWKNRRLGFVSDRLFDWKLRGGSNYQSLVASLDEVPRQKILLVGVASERRQALMRGILDEVTRSRHDVTAAIGNVGSKGKLENINQLCASHQLSAHDWLIMTDDDIVLPHRFLDMFIAACCLFDFKIAMPSHRFDSYSGYDVTRRHWNTLARQVGFVESGPLVAIHRVAHEWIFPLPHLRYGWGVDVHWSLLADREGWSMGAVDATPIAHVSPIGAAYPRAVAAEEACQYLVERGHLSREATFRTIQSYPA